MSEGQPATDLRGSAQLLNSEELGCLLDINKQIFAHIHDMDQTMKIIANAAKEFLKAERTTVWLFASNFSSQNNLRTYILNSQIATETDSHLSITVDQGIVGWVVRNEKPANVPDAYKDERFLQQIDKETGFKTNSVLAVPIYSNSDLHSVDDHLGVINNVDTSKQKETKIIGVLQLINKLNKDTSIFSEQDESMAILFAEYIGIAISNCINYQKVIRANLRTQIAMDILTYHYGIEDSAIEVVLAHLKSGEFCKLTDSFENWDFSSYMLTGQNSISLIIWMFTELGILERFQIDIKTMVRFVLMVQNGYRPEVPYHNWQHAVNVTHFAFLLIRKCNLINYVTQFQLDMLLIATLCHDIDHRGTNNSFQTISASTLAALYSSHGSILERHHLSQALGILNSPGCKILEHLDYQQYNEAIQLLQHLILITDLANHFKSVEETSKLVENYERENQVHQRMLLGLIMTVSDLNQVTKPANISVPIAKLVFEEFHAQGDKEKAFGVSPIAMMDREKFNFRKEQIGFLQFVALPAFNILKGIIPESTPAYLAALELQKFWEEQPSEE